MSLRGVIIVSACTGDASLDEVNHLLAGRIFQRQGCEVTEALGVYKGESEKSWVVHIKRTHDVVVAATIAKGFEQESVLSVDEFGEAKLVYIDGSPSQVIGTLREVEYSEASLCDHTQVGDRYYVAKGGDSNEHVLH